MRSGFFVVWVGQLESVTTLSVSEGRRVALGVVIGQAVATTAIALLCFALAGSNAALSAAIGGSISTMASLALVGFAFRPGLAADARTVARAFYVGEAVKLGVTVVLFALVLRFVKVSGGALFGAYAATFLVYWIALANALPPFLGGRQGGRRT